MSTGGALRARPRSQSPSPSRHCVRVQHVSELSDFSSESPHLHRETRRWSATTSTLRHRAARSGATAEITPTALTRLRSRRPVSVWLLAHETSTGSSPIVRGLMNNLREILPQGPAAKARGIYRTGGGFDADDGPFNGRLERRALRSLGRWTARRERCVLDAGCASGAQCEWLLSEGADVIGIELSPAMVTRQSGDAARRLTSSWPISLNRYPWSPGHLTDHLLVGSPLPQDWDVPLHSFRWRFALLVARALPRPPVLSSTAIPGGATSTRICVRDLEKPPWKRPSTSGADI